MSAAATTIENELPPEHHGDVEDAVPARKLDPGFKRNLKVIGGVAIGVVALAVIMIVWRMGTADKQTAAVSSSLRQSAVDNGNGKEQLSPAMHDALKAKQLSEQQKAAEKGDPVFIPKDTLAAPVSLVPPKPPVSELAPVTQQAAGNPQGTMAPESPRDTMRRKGLEIQLAQLLQANPDLGGASPQRVSFENKAGVGGATTPGAGGTTPAVAAPKGPLVVEGLEILPAETASPIDTYRTKYASARVVAGKLNGAFLIGTSTLIEEGLSTNYTMMRFNGKTYSIDAIALDEKTSTDAMNADIDHRYLQRYIMPVAGAAIGGAATAMSQTGSSVVSTAGGVLGSTPAATGQQAGYAGLAAGVSIAQRAIDREAQKPLQATLPASTPIGILFRAPVELASGK